MIANQSFMLAHILPGMQVAGTALGGMELPTNVAGANSDFEALKKLRFLAIAYRIDSPQAA